MTWGLEVLPGYGGGPPGEGLTRDGGSGSCQVDDPRGLNGRGESGRWEPVRLSGGSLCGRYSG